MFQLCFNLNRIHDSVGKALRTANQGRLTVNSLACTLILVPFGLKQSSGCFSAILRESPVGALYSRVPLEIFPLFLCPPPQRLSVSLFPNPCDFCHFVIFVIFVTFLSLCSVFPCCLDTPESLSIIPDPTVFHRLTIIFMITQ